MGRRQIVEGAERAERRARRQELGSLKSLVLRPSTIQRYEKAFRAFLVYLGNQKLFLASTKTELDHQLEDYLDWLWQDGESISLAGDTLSSIQHFQPSCKRNLNGAWRLLKAWQLHELPSRAPPFTWDTLKIFLGRMIQISPQVALGIFLAFKCLLRTGELLALVNQDIILSPDGSTVILHLGLTKTAGRNPSSGTVNVTDNLLVQLLTRWQQSCHNLSPLIPWTPSKFRTTFSQALSDCDLTHMQFKPYSLRRGGATDMYLSSRNYALVQHTGRWSSERVMRQYIQDSTALLTQIRFVPSPKQQRLMAQWARFSHVEPSVTRKVRGRGKK